jgi:hypothetical protein
MQGYPLGPRRLPIDIGVREHIDDHLERGRSRSMIVTVRIVDVNPTHPVQLDEDIMAPRTSSIPGDTPPA